MPDVAILPLRPDHLAQTETWTSSQNALKTLLKLPGESLAPGSGTYGWAAVEGSEVLAVALVRLTKEHVGYLECLVKPSARRQGIASKLVAHLLGEPMIESLVHLHAAVDPANIAARKTLEEQGFSRVGYTADGRLEFARHKY